MKIDLSEERLMRLAENATDEDRLYDALRWANKADRLYEIKNTYRYQALLAEIYEHAGVVEGALQHWFYALDVADASEVGEVYEALAYCFDTRGDKVTASFYYDKAMKSPGFIGEFELAEQPMEPPATKNIFRRVFPCEKADFTQEILSAIDEMRKGEFAEAERKLEEIPHAAKDYRKAGNFLAVSKLMQGKGEEAVKVAEDLYRTYPDDSEIAVTLATAYKADERVEEGMAIAKQLIKRTDLSNDEMFKVAALLCELELHQDAYEYTKILGNYMPFDGNLLYMSGAAACNSKNYEDGIRTFEKLVTMYPDAYVVRYYQSYYQNGGREKMPYVYRVFEEERRRREAYLGYLMSMEQSDAMLEYEERMQEIDELLLWCFDEMDGQDIRLQAYAITVAIHLEAYEFLQEILMNYQVEDVIKVEIIRDLCVKNKDVFFRVVVYNLYQTVRLPKLSIGRKARKKFLEGYAECVSQFGLRIDGLMDVLPEKAEDFYRRLEKHEKLDGVKSPQTVAIALCYLCGLKKEREAIKMLCLLLDANLDDVFRLLEVYDE
ncbi:MAG: hypothetical protein J5993_01215 [Clostridia bacterium]|nr:hypothetical protein [Clostridia bacterium]